MSVISLEEYKQQLKPHQNTDATTQPLNLRLEDGLGTGINGQVMTKETNFTRLSQEKLRLKLNRPDLEMRLMALPQEHAEEEYTYISYRYLIYDGKTSEVIINSLIINSYSTFCISDIDEEYLFNNGYNLKTILKPIFEVLVNSSTKLSTLDKEKLLSTI